MNRFALLGGLACVFALLGLARAETLTVNSTADHGPDSLRQAISRAEPGDTIQVQASGRIALESELNVDKDLRLIGPGPGKLAISGSRLHRVFHLGSGIAVHLEQIAIIKGVAGTGGGIYSNARELSMDSCLLSQNGSVIDGGGLYLRNGDATIQNSAFTENDSAAGGAIFIDGGSLSLVNCTLSGNRADGGGGAVYNAGTLWVAHSTICANTAALGGALYTLGEGQATFSHTLLLGNLARISHSDIWGRVRSQGFNLVGEDHQDFNQPSDQTGIFMDAVVESEIAELGGPTPVHGLLPKGPAVDSGDPQAKNLPETDQRGQGFARVMDGDGDENAVIDIGAVEMALEPEKTLFIGPPPPPEMEKPQTQGPPEPVRPKTPELILRRSFLPSPVMAGQLLSFKLIAENNGTGPAQKVSLLVNFPPQLQDIKYGLANTDSLMGWTGSRLLGEIPAGGSKTIRFQGILDPAAPAGTFAFTARLIANGLDPEGEDLKLAPAIPLQRAADLTITQQAIVFPTGELMITLELLNQGPSQCGAIRVMDILPAELEYISHEGDGMYNYATGLWLVSGLPATPPQNRAVIRIRTQPKKRGAFRNICAITGAEIEDPKKSNNAHSLIIDTTITGGDASR